MFKKLSITALTCLAFWGSCLAMKQAPAASATSQAGLDQPGTIWQRANERLQIGIEHATTTDTHFLAVFAQSLHPQNPSINHIPMLDRFRTRKLAHVLGILRTESSQEGLVLNQDIFHASCATLAMVKKLANTNRLLATLDQTPPIAHLFPDFLGECQPTPYVPHAVYGTAELSGDGFIETYFDLLSQSLGNFVLSSGACPAEDLQYRQKMVGEGQGFLQEKLDIIENQILNSPHQSSIHLSNDAGTIGDELNTFLPLAFTKPYPELDKLAESMARSRLSAQNRAVESGAGSAEKNKADKSDYDADQSQNSHDADSQEELQHPPQRTGLRNQKNADSMPLIYVPAAAASSQNQGIVAALEADAAREEDESASIHEKDLPKAKKTRREEPKKEND